MGTVFTLDVRDPGDWSGPLGEVVAWLHRVDTVFSTYRPDSAVSRLGRGEITLADCPPDVAQVLELCGEVAEASHGAFSTHARGGLDPSGLVKGWAIEQASLILRAAGSSNHAVNGGGDMQLAGEAAPGEPWRVGIAHPGRPGALATVVAGRDLAVASSGTAERGAHVHDPRTGQPVTALASVTLTGARLTLVDAYATAALVLGTQAQAWVEQLAGVEAFGVRPNGTVWATEGFPFAPAAG